MKIINFHPSLCSLLAWLLVIDNGKPLRGKDIFLVFGAPLNGEPEIEDVVQCICSEWLGTGPKVARFEKEFATYKSVKYAVTLNSCAAVLYFSILAAGVGHRDGGITTLMTFCATVNANIRAGVTPVLADIDLNQIESNISSKTKIVIPFHLTGQSCEVDAICDIAQCHNFKVIEDCAPAVKMEYHGKNAGTFGEFGCFSFYVTKNVATDEGGMVLTEHEEDAANIKTLGLHAMSKDVWKRFSDEGYKHYQVVECGFKYNMMDLQTAIGIHQLTRIEQNWQKRQVIWNQYKTAFKDLPVTTPAETAPNTRHAYHLYAILIDEQQTGISRDTFLDLMTKHNIGVGVHYLNIPEHPYYQQTYGWKPEDYPHSMKIGKQTVSLPISAKLLNVNVENVIDAARNVFK
jgi:dTDP-4-amino-4,6-dideoxygalactose transaminase